MVSPKTDKFRSDNIGRNRSRKKFGSSRIRRYRRKVLGEQSSNGNEQTMNVQEDECTESDSEWTCESSEEDEDDYAEEIEENIGRNKGNIIISVKTLDELINLKHDCPLQKKVQIKQNGVRTSIDIWCPCGWSPPLYPSTESKLTECAVIGTIAGGGGARTLNKLMASLNLPTMRPNTFSEKEEQLGRIMKERFNQESLEAHREEIKYAKFYKDGLPCIRVQVDGGWGKVSHGHSYDSNTGVAVVIGAHTKKVLQVVPKTASCMACLRGNNPHQCSKNHTDASGAMETDGIVEAFNNAPNMFGCYYGEYISDGDSSTADAIIQRVPYGSTVKKISCVNHIVKNMRKSLELVRKQKGARLTSHQVRRITYSVRESIRRNVGDRQGCVDGIKNSLFHVGGDHRNCPVTFCHHDGTHQELPWNEDTISQIKRALEKVCLMPTMELNETNNGCEQFMNMRTALDGHKHVDRGKGRSWETRCYAAALKMNHGNTWITEVIEISEESEEYFIRLDELTAYSKQFRSETGQRRRRKLQKICNRAARRNDYGKGSVNDYDIPLPELVSEAAIVYKRTISSQASGEQGSNKWLSERRERITASNFGRISKMRAGTSPANTVKSLLYSSFNGNSSTQYGLDQEAETEQIYTNFLISSGAKNVIITKPTLI